MDTYIMLKHAQEGCILAGLCDELERLVETQNINPDFARDLRRFLSAARDAHHDSMGSWCASVRRGATTLLPYF